MKRIHRGQWAPNNFCLQMHPTDDNRHKRNANLNEQHWLRQKRTIKWIIQFATSPIVIKFLNKKKKSLLSFNHTWLAENARTFSWNHNWRKWETSWPTWGPNSKKPPPFPTRIACLFVRLNRGPPVRGAIPPTLPT